MADPIETRVLHLDEREIVTEMRRRASQCEGSQEALDLHWKATALSYLEGIEGFLSVLVQELQGESEGDDD
jgi:hypothetical protein